MAMTLPSGRVLARSGAPAPAAVRREMRAMPSAATARPRRSEQENGTLASAFAKAAERLLLEEKQRRYRNDPVLWAKERLNLDLWSMQREISESLVVNKKTVVKSCHDSGKTYLAAVLVCWWIDTHPPEETMVISTAPTSYQVNKLLWEYVRKLHRAHNLLGDVSEAAEWKSDDRDVIGMGRKPADTNIHGFQGIHRRFVFVVIDEACGVPEQIWTGVEAITTNDENRILAIGNPDDPVTEFGRIFNQNDESWAKFTISAFSTPNFTEEHKELDPIVAGNLLSTKWVAEKEKSWGKNSSRYLAKVLGEFPKQSHDTLFPPMLLNRALGAEVDLLKGISTEQRPVFGVDVARFGEDLTTVVMNFGGILTVVDSWDKTDIVESAQRIHDLAVKHGASEIRVDATGIGAGLVDVLRTKASTFYLVYEMVGAAASPDPRQWINARAYWHDNFLTMLKDSTVSLPGFTDKGSDEQVLYEELEGLRYKFKNGALQIESKDEIRKSGRKSPDFSDAAMYATAVIDDDDLLTHFDPGEVISYDPADIYAARGYAISPY